eukprot:jgi/Bigna1/33626/e_gw1.2.53.1
MPLLLVIVAATWAVPPSSLAQPVYGTDNVALSNGVIMPMAATGVWRFSDAEAEKGVTDAIAAGFRHIDTANNYSNQHGVGVALKGHDRSSIFLTTKIESCDSLKALETCRVFTQTKLEEDLSQLALDYVDLMLLHNPPGGGCRIPLNCQIIQEQWRAMQEFYFNGSARAIGVSNFCQDCFECLASSKHSTVMPMVNQIRYHVGMGRDLYGLISYMHDKGIVPQAWSPLARGTLAHDFDTKAIAAGLSTDKLDITAAQVALRWLVQHRIAVVSAAKDPIFLAQNSAIFDFELAEADMARLDAKNDSSDTPSFLGSLLLLLLLLQLLLL